jgi:cyanophycin synthetase
MEVTRIRALRGPNLWSHHTAIQSVVACTPQEANVRQIDGFESRIRARFPEISPFQPVGNDDKISMAQVLELAALGLQAQAGCPVTFSRTTSTMETHVYQVVVEYSEEDVGFLAMDIAQQLCQSALDNTPFELADALTKLKDLDEDVRLGPSTGSIVDAAVARGIPFSRMTEGSMVRFGWGSKQRRIQAAEMDITRTNNSPSDYWPLRACPCLVAAR